MGVVGAAGDVPSSDNRSELRVLNIGPVGSQNRSVAESLSFSPPAFDQSTAKGRPDPDEESVSYRAVTQCRMLLAMWHLLKFTTTLFRCTLAFFKKPERASTH